MPATLPRVPCYSCGTDWHDDAAAVARILNPDALAIIEGCECPGCETLRAVETPDDSPAPTAEQAFDALAPVQVNYRTDRYTTRSRIVGLCPTCAERATAALLMGRPEGSCDWCSSVPRRALTEIGLSFGTSNDGDTFTPLNVTDITVGGRGRMPVPDQARGLRWTGSRTIGDDFAPVEQRHGETHNVCSACRSSASTCDNCSYLMSSGSSNWCDECEVTVCSDCWDSEYHYEHNDDSDGYDRARYNFSPRSTVQGALAAAGAPGSTVLSTRAIGIEVETARGDAQQVINAEREAVVPVIAAAGTDASVRGRNPIEYRLLPQRGTWVEYALRSMHAWCRDAGYAPDSSAGVHMHVDCSGMSVQQVWRAFAALVIAEPVLYAHAAPERRRNQYCQPITDAENVVAHALRESNNPDAIVRDHYGRRRVAYFDVSMAGVSSRYASINGQSFSAHQTLEVRVFDCDHSEAGVERYIDAAAIIAALVDFSQSDEWATFVGDGRNLVGVLPAMRLLSALVLNNLITTETFTRAWSRLDVTADALVAA